ncbi:uncharacterized protein MELLADRAFT_77268 [Melampsora larici-populina 98AG31]|uniref:SUI1 domain-containing protein n=1 Tax=Melampsora larici-populina (strain 98AG31 / pathotype 3-4-7) TaxID=747676 RepID=F4RFL2_MELLP|nr:uncharacterized protein MELLADRAFT_77268 [Melampsora larici-populina 98AG31]EGG08825.1 hypothetical protein MELLADRAFT_77268 [Melampsora larici-populina 98AG31]
MFKRPHQTKPAAPISSSARRKLINEAISTFFTNLLPAHKQLLQQLMPEGLRMARVSTHLKNPLLLYTDLEGEPLWLKLDKGEGILVPSLYTILKFPSLLPILPTNQAVLEKLTGGADLMIPGVSQSTKQTLKGLASRTLVTISDFDSGAPWAVGYLEISGDELASLATGKAVVTIHAKDDFLWQSGSKRPPSELKLDTSPDVTDETIPEDPSKADLCNEVQSLELEPKVVPQKSPDLKLPPDASAFYSNHILPLRPHDCPKNVGVKDSSFKTLHKWLKAMQKKEFLVVKEEPDAEKQAARQAGAGSKSPGVIVLSETAPVTSIVISQVFKAANPAQKRLFECLNLDPQGLHDRQTIRVALNTSPTLKGSAQRLIVADPILAEAIGSDKPSDPCTREKLFSGLIDALDHWWRMSKGSEVIVEKKGPVPMIDMSLKRGGSNKYATKIAGLELYEIDPVRLAKQLRTMCAVSTSILPATTSPSLQLPKTLLKEGAAVVLHCQGDQRNIIRKYLIEKVGVPKEAILEK